jgi:predicted transposase YdaD
MRNRAKPRSFDATGKNIIDLDPRGLVQWLGYNVAKVRVLNSDLATRLAADRLILLVDEGIILNIELQAQYDPHIRERLLAYMGLIWLKYHLPVKTVVILLCKRADGKALRDPRLESEDVRFQFRVIRLWDESPDEFFAGSPTLLALMPLANVSKAQLPTYIRRACDVIAEAYRPVVQKRFWGDTLIYMGLKHDMEFSEHLLEGVYKMLDLSTSSTYKGIKAEGKAEGVAEGKRESLIAVGSRRFGEPDAGVRSVLDQILSLERLVV